MNIRWVLTGAMALALLASPVAAQSSADQKKEQREAEEQMQRAARQMREAERQVREAARQLAKLGVERKIINIDKKVVLFDDRARLGVVLRSDADPKTDAIGAYIQALTPGSPAEEAGLRPGDIITKFNGQSLAGGKGEEDEDRSAPAARLAELAHSLKDGDKVALEYKRGDTTATTTLVARRLLGPRIKILGPPEGVIEIPDVDIPDIDVDVSTLGHPWRDVDLVAMNPELGEYFGTSDGILVVRVPKDDPLKLKGGDVILKIGSRSPTSPTQAMRILRTYEAGENVALEVLRKHQKITISVQVPPRRSGFLRWHGEAPEPPEAPEAPAAPAPPAAPPPPPSMLE
jgi:C-terminal processing protease CtpA/Prc